MNNSQYWLSHRASGSTLLAVDGLVQVFGYQNDSRPPEEVAVMEKASLYGAVAVFFEAGRNGSPAVAQALIFDAGGGADDEAFAELHRKLWSWGGVPLLYRRLPGAVQLFRCAHEPDFLSKSGKMVCNPVKELALAGAISADPWWDAKRLRNGTIWDDPKVCKALLSEKKASHKALIGAVKGVYDTLLAKKVLPAKLGRKLLILSLLIAYLEQREAFEDGFFARFLPGAVRFFEVLANGPALLALLEELEHRFNGDVFSLEPADRDYLKSSQDLAHFSRLVEGRTEVSGQLTLWELYSFKDLPVELVSHIYQLFVADADSSIYTPPFVVRLILEEALGWDRIDRLLQRGEVILDPACGSGVFLVEAYKRLVLHWRQRHGWGMPGIETLKELLQHVHGIDLEAGAIELTAFSLCLALCDALEPQALRASAKLFPPLVGNTLHHSCFFLAKEKGIIQNPVGVVVGNPPFKSKLETPGAERSYVRFAQDDGGEKSLPDRQLAYLFLHEAMGMVAEGGLLAMLQQHGFLYNQQTQPFRHAFIEKWDVREILDFISVRGLFQKGGADTKVLLLVAEASPPLREPGREREILHVTFRRSGRSDAEQGFDLDCYDMHWVPRALALGNNAVWRANLLGGGRALDFVDRVKKFRTFERYARDSGWDFGEGFVEGGRDAKRSAGHIIGKPMIRPAALTLDGLNVSAISQASDRAYERPRSEKRFSPPMLLIREHMDLPHDFWGRSYLTYTNEIVGFCADAADAGKLEAASAWLSENKATLRAWVALTSPRLFIQRATALAQQDIFSLPFPDDGDLRVSPNEAILLADINDYTCDLIRFGEESAAMCNGGFEALPEFNHIFARQINAVYQSNPLHALPAQRWPGMVCQPFVFGDGAVDWSGAEGLQDKLSGLLHEQQGAQLHVTRICRLYDGDFIFLLKPDRLRFWLRSVALRDADETMADLRDQGF